MYISNSTIINAGTGGTLSNATSFGSLQLMNSTILANSGTSINYSASTVISSNSQVNTAYNITTFIGNIDTITEISY